MPLDQCVLSVFWQGKAFFFCRASSKASLKYLYIKSVQNQYLFRQYLWHVSCETGLKRVHFCPNALLKVQCRVIFPKTFSAN